jgi:hypothetical protein
MSSHPNKDNANKRAAANKFQKEDERELQQSTQSKTEKRTEK